VKKHNGSDPSQNLQILIGDSRFGDYDKVTYEVIQEILKKQEKQIQWLISAATNKKTLKAIFSDFLCVKEMLQILDPQFKFCLFEVRRFSWWELGTLAGRLLSMCLFVLAMVFKPFVQQYLWIIITVIYIPAMYIFDSISDEYILINPEDVAHFPLFDFAPNVSNCSSAPKGHPLLLTYSHQIVSGWYDVLVYAFTIGFTVRQLGQAQIPIYDWITVDELMDDECETDEDEQLFSYRGQKMTRFECMDILIEGFFYAILVGKFKAAEEDVIMKMMDSSHVDAQLGSVDTKHANVPASTSGSPSVQN
jgi:hypothetical protein